MPTLWSPLPQCHLLSCDSGSLNQRQQSIKETELRIARLNHLSASPSSQTKPTARVSEWIIHTFQKLVSFRKAVARMLLRTIVKESLTKMEVVQQRHLIQDPSPVTRPRQQGSQRLSKHGKTIFHTDCLKVVHRKKVGKATELLNCRKFQVKLIREKTSDLYNSKDTFKF